MCHVQGHCLIAYGPTNLFHIFLSIVYKLCVKPINV